jgi:hypothetical protein
VSLLPAVIPLFLCCYAAVISLLLRCYFAVFERAGSAKIALLHGVRSPWDGDFEPEQRVAACGAGPASIVAVADAEPANFQQMQVKRTTAG